MYDWLVSNKEWVFSGIGVTIVFTLLGCFSSKILKKRDDTAGTKQYIKSGNNSNNTQINNVKIDTKGADKPDE